MLAGRVQVSLRVANGAVYEAHIEENGTGDSALGACVVDRTHGLTFPPDLTVDLVVPFVLSASLSCAARESTESSHQPAIKAPDFKRSRLSDKLRCFVVDEQRRPFLAMVPFFNGLLTVLLLVPIGFVNYYSASAGSRHGPEIKSTRAGLSAGDRC